MAFPAGDMLRIYTARYGVLVRLGSLLNVIVIDGELVIGGLFNDMNAAQDNDAENVERARSTVLAVTYMTKWQVNAQDSELYVGRGVRQ